MHIAHIHAFTAAISPQGGAAVYKRGHQAMNRSPRKTDIWILPQGTLTLVRPLTQRASEWVSQHLRDHSQWFGPALLIEQCYVPNLLDGMIADGLQVTR